MGKSALVLLLCMSPAAAFVPSVRQSVLRSKTPKSPQTVQMATASFNGADYKSLLNSNRAKVDSLASVAPDVPEITRLRFALAFPDQAEAVSNLKDSIAWREGAGRSIVESAAAAVAKATENGGWDNEIVANAAPHAATINEFITSKSILTLSTEAGDLLYVIRASGIDDRAMMNKVPVQHLVDFFLYVKEVHSLVANARTERTGRFCGVVFANDIKGTRNIPDKRFSEALTSSSQQYEKLYPAMAGQTMILNLPFILQAFVGLFKPLFPKSVQERLVFTSAPVLAKLQELTPLTTDANTRKAFDAEITKLLR